MDARIGGFITAGLIASLIVALTLLRLLAPAVSGQPDNVVQPMTSALNTLVGVLATLIVASVNVTAKKTVSGGDGTVLATTTTSIKGEQ